MRLRTALLAAALVALPSACGGREDPGSGSGPTTTAPSVSAAKLTVPYACGTGFQVSDPNQTVALFVEWRGAGAAAGGPLTGGDWHAELRLGRALFSNWCDDVVEPDEPVPAVDEVIEVTAGSVEDLSAPDTDPSFAGNASQQASAHLAGVVATRADGSTIELGDLDVTNPCWGCAAG